MAIFPGPRDTARVWSFGDGLLLDLADIDNSGGRDRPSQLRMTKLQVHATTDETQLDHGAAPGRTMNTHLDGFRAILRVPPDERPPATLLDQGVAAAFGLNFQPRPAWPISRPGRSSPLFLPDWQGILPRY